MNWFKLIEDFIMFFSILSVGFASGVLFAEKRFSEVVKNIYKEIYGK